MLKTRTEKQTQTLVDFVFHYDTNTDFFPIDLSQFKAPTPLRWTI